MGLSTISGDVYFDGDVSFKTLNLPSGGVKDAQVAGTAAIDATKLKHQHVVTDGQVHGAAAAAERRVIHIARGAGTLESFKVMPVVAAAGDATVSVDLRKNGTTVLTGTVSVTSSDAAYAKKTATFAGGATAYAAGDVFEVVQTVAAGTGTLPQGVSWTLTAREDPS